MGVSQGFIRDVPAHRIDVRLAGLGLLVAVLLFPLRFLASNVFVETIPVVLAAGCVLYVAATRTSRARATLPALPDGLVALAPAAVVAGLAALLALVRMTGGRTLPFYALAGLLGSLVLVQVFFADDDALQPGVVLAQVLGLSLVIRFSALYSVPGYIGVDAWVHVPVWTAGIASTGTLAPLAGEYYLTAPFYHVYVATAASVIDTTLRNALFMTLGTVLALSTALVYATARYFVAARWALAAAAMAAVADQFIRWSIHLIPESLALVFFLGALYGLTRMYVTGHDARSVGLTLMFSLAVVFTHQLSTFILLTLLGIGAVAQVSLRLFDGLSAEEARLTAVGLFAVTLAVTVVTWLNTPYGDTSFLVRMTEGITRDIVTNVGFLGGAAGGDGGGGTGAGWLVQYVDVLGLLLLLFVTVIGSLAVVDENRSTEATLTYLGAIVIMLVVTLGLPLFGVRSFLPGRWLAFLYAPMIVVGVVGLARLSRTSNAAVVTAVLLVFALAFPGAMVVAEKATLDSPVFEDRQARFAYTQSELAAVETIGAILPSDGGAHVYTDHPYRTLFRRLGGYTAPIVQVDDGGTVVSAGPVVYRDYQASGGAIVRTIEDDPREGTHLAVPAAGLCPPGRQVVYANDDVRLCLPAEGA